MLRPAEPMPVIYLRNEPTIDRVSRSGVASMDAIYRDVVAYDDAEATKVKLRWPWDAGLKPTRRSKRLNLDSGQWQIVWLPDLPMR